MLKNGTLIAEELSFQKRIEIRQKIAVDRSRSTERAREKSLKT